MAVTTHLSRSSRIAAIAALAVAVLAAWVVPVSAAPSLGVQIAREQTAINHGDGRVNYVVKVSNSTPAAATCSPGTWTGTPAPTFSYRWLRDGVAIAGEAAATYTLQPADQGRSLQCQVIATNTGAASTRVTAPRYVGATPAFGPPSGTTFPTIAASPTATSGSVQTCTAPTGWGGSPTWTFEWLRNGVPATGATTTPTATTSTYTVQPSDVSPAAVLQCKAIATNGTGAVSTISANKNTTPAPTTPPANTMTAANAPTLSGAEYTSGAITVSFGFPDGVELATGGTPSGGSGWTCYTAASSCTNSGVLAPGASLPDLPVRASIYPERAPDVISTVVTAFGGGAAASAVDQDSVILGPALPFGLASLTAAAEDVAGDDYTQAGGHPFSATSTFQANTKQSPIAPDPGRLDAVPVEALRDVFVDLPVGFVGNPESAAACTMRQVSEAACPEPAAVGGVELRFSDGEIAQLGGTPIYRVIPEDGYPAGFAFTPAQVSQLTVVLRPKLRSNGDYGVTVTSPLPPQDPEIIGVNFATLCNYGASMHVGQFGEGAIFDGCKQQGDPGMHEIPLLTNPTECSGSEPITSVAIDSFENPGNQTPDGFADLTDERWKSRSTTTPPITGCDQVPFDPDMSILPTATGPDSASGLDVDLDLPQDGLLDYDEIATSHLKKTVVQLPEGFSVNPSAATGLEGCTDEQIAVHRLTPPNCPDGSRLGTATVTSPIVDQPLRGTMFLATPKSTDPQSGEMLRLWLSVRNEKLGLSAKLPGSAVADPATGRLAATFDNNPRVPFDHLEVDLKGGQRGVLATPQDCGEKTTTSTLTPWSGTAPVDDSTDTDIDGDCGEKFAPRMSAGNSDNTARGKGGTYSFKFSREDGEQWLRGLTAKLPQGLLASVKDVPLCSNAAADAGDCPADSKIGVVDAKAGAGDPFVLEQKGEVFLTEGYKGGEYGLAVKIRPVAGPFRGDMELSPIIVRQAIHVDRTTAQVTAISDPFPLIHHGIPLRAREVSVLINRSGFMLNPSDCSQKQTAASLLSAEGATSNLSDSFQISGCGNLAFRPTLALSLTGKRQVTTGKHPGIKAVVTQQGTSEAGIEQAVVRLPKSLALDPENAQALCEFTDGTKPDLENHCPAGSIVGRARAKTPLLRNDLVGNVYFVKNVRIDPTTGNEIRTLPMLIVALRGEIAINLKGESSTTKGGKLVNTFASVPDAPISQFNLNIKGGSTGIIAVTRTRKAKINLCTGRHIAETDMDAQNGRRHDFDIRMKTPCTKKQTKAAKRAAKRASRRG